MHIDTLLIWNTRSYCNKPKPLSVGDTYDHSHPQLFLLPVAEGADDPDDVPAVEDLLPLTPEIAAILTSVDTVSIVAVTLVV